MFFYHRQYCRICPYQANAYNNIYSIKYCTKQAAKIAAIFVQNYILQSDAWRRSIIADAGPLPRYGDYKGGVNNDNTCNTRRYNGHRKRGYYPNIVRAAPLDGRKNESKKMVASKL